jgi:hypothetical protein
MYKGWIIMYKGWRGFLYVGTFAVPLICVIWGTIVYYINNNIGATVMGMVAILWIVNCWITDILKVHYKYLAELAIAYIKTLPDRITDSIENNKD